MTSPVSPLATVREDAKLVVDLAYDEDYAAIHCERIRAAGRRILAVLDSLDGTITLTQDEAEQLMIALTWVPPKHRHGPRALLDARIEEAGK